MKITIRKYRKNDLFKHETTYQIVYYIFIIIGSIVVLFPMLWMLMASLKNSYQVFNTFWPNPIVFKNYIEIFTKLPFSFFNWVKNSVIITFFSIVGVILSSTFVAYGFARFRAKFKKILFIILLSTMMLPGSVTMIPTYLMYSKFGWIDTYLPLIVPCFFGSAYYIFLIRQYFMTIPQELFDAAKMDGAGNLRILYQILVPLLKPVIIYVAIMQFNASWNDFMGPVLYLNSIEKYTLALGINFFKSQSGVQWNYLMAASVVSAIPPLILFIVAQKYFIESINLSGVK